MPIPEKHLFVCTGDDCRKRGSKKLCKAFKEALDDHDLKRRVKVMEVDCFDQCAHGPIVLVYPDATWYADLDHRDAETIVTQHLVGGQPVSEKLYHRAHGKKHR
jgi:(2Fe-2S) ferredoxin